MYKLLNSENTNLLQHPNHNYPTRTRQNFRIPKHNVTIFQHSLAYLGPRIWNALPDYIKLKQTLHSFKTQLKRHIRTVLVELHTNNIKYFFFSKVMLCLVLN